MDETPASGRTTGSRIDGTGLGARDVHTERTERTDAGRAPGPLLESPYRIPWSRLMSDGDYSYDPNDYRDGTDRWVQ